MVLGITILGFIAALWLAAALYPVIRHGISFRQGLLYAPLQLIYSIDDRQIALARKCRTPVIYVVLHRSALDPALMLALLPDTTLHILDERSAAAAWLEPYRDIAPTIAFNAEHVFVSRRLVRRLKGGGRLAVYIPDEIEPDPKEFRLYRAIARIASQADARIVPIDIAGARNLPFSNTPAAKVARRWFPCLTIRALEGRTIGELVEQAGENRTTRAHALFDRLAELRLASASSERSLFRALADCARRNGTRRIILEDPVLGRMSYRRLFTAARIVGRHVQGRTMGAAEPVGLLLPDSPHMMTGFLGAQSAGRPVAMIDPGADPEDVAAFLRTAGVRLVLTSRAALAGPAIEKLVEALEAGGVRMLRIDEILAATGRTARFAARLGWRFALHRRGPDDPAVMLAGRIEPGSTEVLVFTHRNILANILQLQTRVDVSMADTVVNLLPAHQCAGLAGGTLLALMAGARLRIAATQAKTPASGAGAPPTILLATEAQLAELAQKGGIDLSRLRAIFAGAEPVTAQTRQFYRERHRIEIMEGYAFGPAAPIVAVNTLTHAREGTVGRLLPGIRMRLEPVDGVDGAARLWLQGPSLFSYRIREDQPGKLLPLGEWLDTGDLVSVDREGFLTLRRQEEEAAPGASDAEAPAA